MKKFVLSLAGFAMLSFSAVAAVSDVWVADLGNGKYQNPILYADYSRSRPVSGR